MNRHRRGSRELRFADSAFLEALDGRESGGDSPNRQFERKAKQFCRQVQQALNFSLADRVIADGHAQFYVEEVLPAPDCGRLLVRVLAPDGLSVAEAMRALSSEASRLRCEVAAGISRKRAPQLSFVLANPEEDADD